MLSFNEFIDQRGVGAKPHISDSIDNRYLWDVAQRYAALEQGAQKPIPNKQSTQSICKTCKKRFHCDVWALEHNEYPLELVVSSCREYVLDS